VEFGKAKIANHFQIKECSIYDVDQWFGLATPPKKPVTVPDTYVNIIAHNGLCLSEKAIKHNLAQDKCGLSESLKWIFIKEKNGYSIKSITKQVLDNDKDINKIGNLVDTKKRDTKSDNAQLFDVIAASNGKNVLIRNIHTNKCVEFGKAKIANFFQLIECNDSDVNQWFNLATPPKRPEFIPVPAPVVKPVNPYEPETGGPTPPKKPVNPTEPETGGPTPPRPHVNPIPRPEVDPIPVKPTTKPWPVKPVTPNSNTGRLPESDRNPVFVDGEWYRN